MGYLLGAFGKQMAGSRYRSIQARMMKVQSRARRVSRDIDRVNKMIDRYEKSAKNSIQMQVNATNMMTQQRLLQSVMGKWSGTTNTDSLTPEQQAAYNKDYSNYQQQLSQAQAMTSFQQAASQQQIEDYVNYLKDNMLEPLKDEEDLLQSEKDTLETEIQLAKNDYDACKQMEKDAAQSFFKPEYTGGGN